MAREAKRHRSNSCRDLIDTSPLESNFTQSWDRLPLELAVKIYHFLPRNDKCNMSLTSKFWLSAFRHPGTWRYFVFTGKMLSKKIPGDVLSSLQYVTIDCSGPSRTVYYTFKMQEAKRLVKFVEGLKKSTNTTLQKLNILDMKFLGLHATSCRLPDHLTTLLAKQTKLSRLSLFNGGLTTARGLKLIAAAGQNSAHCLKYLNVHNFSRQTPTPASDVKFAQLCGRFTNLTELRLSSGFMSDDLLNHLSGTLKLITVWVHSYDFARPAVHHKSSDNGWNVLVAKCTGLKAEYHVEELYNDINLSLVLLPAVPLATFHWCAYSGDRVRKISQFDRIINTFKNGLEHLHVDVGCSVLNERGVVAVVQRCPLLQSFYISGTSIPLQLISQLENILIQRRLNKRLQTGTFTATDIW